MSFSKESIRQEFIRKRKALTNEEVQQLSKKIVDNIRALPSYKTAKIVAIYYPMNQEVDLLDLLKDDKIFCFPKVISFPTSMMDFFEPGETYEISAFGIHEPTGKYVSGHDIDLFLVPGVAFSNEGGRIGYGKGFYDKYLKDISVKKIGVMYGFQRIDAFELSEFDTLLDELVSEEE
ncbi:MAG: 5-formyltetrahydrofolate cyclo-ligase [Candidatus Izemoplasmatales bacterium]